MSRPGLRDRVMLGAVAALAVGVAVLSVAINVLLANRLGADASSVLHDRADAVRATLDTTGGVVGVREAPNDQALDRQSWIFARGRPIERAGASLEVERAAAHLAGAPTSAERTVAGRTRLRAEPTFDRRRRRLATIVVGVSLLPYRHTERIALLGTVALDVFVLIAGAVVARRAVGAALRPVAQMTESAAEWSEHDLHRRFGLGPPRDELTALAATLDGLLGRIDAALRHEQRFSAEMAHELRTPLSGVRAEAELALRPERSEAELREALGRVLSGTDRMAAVVDTLMSVARGDAGHAPGSSDAAGPVRAVVETVRPQANARDVEIAVVAPSGPLSVGADEDLVAQTLHPLVDNAVRHARRKVTLVLGESDGEVVFDVSDDGPGVPPEAIERIFEPGASGSGGAGLGLPLARRVARSCGGDVDAVPSLTGGRFRLRLPDTGVLGS